MAYNLISELQFPNRDWKIKGRIARLWDSINHSENDLLMSVDAYIVDEKGNSILATIKPENGDYFKALLDEKEIYYFSNFSVFPVRSSYRPCPNEYMIKFDRKTKIEKTMDSANDFPPDRFHFINYEQMKSRVRNKVYLTDMIGQLLTVWPEEEIYSNQRMVKLKKLEFEDEKMNKIKATLWGELAVKFDGEKLLENSQGKPMVIILAGMMVSRFSEDTILSSTSASKVYIDLEIPEVYQMQTRIIQPQTLQIMPRSEGRLMNVGEKLMNNRRTVAELLLLDKHNDAHLKFTCRAKITSIDVSDGWWYASCPRCGKTTKSWKNTIVCSKCSDIDETPIPTYILHAMVEDETGEALFTIFDRQAEKMIGISAAAITSMKGSNRYVLPQIIVDVFPIYHTFQVAINQNNKRTKSICFKVTNIFTDVVHSKDKSEKPLKTPTIKDKQIDGNAEDDITSLESTFSKTQQNIQFGQTQSDMKIHTPEKSKSITKKRRTQHVIIEEDSDASKSSDEPLAISMKKNKKYKQRRTRHVIKEDSDESKSDDEPLAISTKKNIKHKPRNTNTIAESCQQSKTQKTSVISTNKKGKKVAK